MTVAELAAKMEDFRAMLTEQQASCIECSTRVKTTLQNINGDAKEINSAITGAADAPSLHTRLAVIEDKIMLIEKTSQLRITHLITLAAALLGSATAIVLALLK